MAFVPQRVIFEHGALDYDRGKKLYAFFTGQGTEIQFAGSHNRITGIPGKTPQEGYLEAKRTLVVGVRKSTGFQTCKPSADYQLPLATSCPGKCEYCYLATTLGKKPYVRIYVNTGEILDRARDYIARRAPEITTFEGAATSDPVPVEPYSEALRDAIHFFARQEMARFRFVTKYTEVDVLLQIKHEKHTTIRFSTNAETYIKKFEHNTPDLRERLQAAQAVAGAGYPLGILVAPIFKFAGWQEEYEGMLTQMAQVLPREGLSFELISHRFTSSAKKRILDVFPRTSLPMAEQDRTFKFGQFGYGKYVYTKEDMEEMKRFFQAAISRLFPAARILYFV